MVTLMLIQIIFYSRQLNNYKLITTLGELYAQIPTNVDNPEMSYEEGSRIKIKAFVVWIDNFKALFVKSRR